MQAEHLGGVNRRQFLDVGSEDVDVAGVRHRVPREELDTLLHVALVEVLRGVRVHEQLVEPVGDPPAVLDRRDHVRHGGPRGRLELLDVHLAGVVLEKLDTRGEIGGVELVLDVPPDGAELATLLNHGVEVAHDVQQLAPLVEGHRVDHVLADPVVGVPETGAHADGRLVGELDGHLEEADGELRVGLGGDPQPEVVVKLLRLGEVHLDLGHVVQAEVGVLQNHPLALLDSRLDELPCDDLLPLAHGHAGELELLLLGELLDELRGVRAGRQEADDRNVRRGLLPGGLHVDGHRLDESLPDGVADVRLRRDLRPVLAHSLDDHHLLKLGDSILKVRHVDLLGSLEVVPLLPHRLVAIERVEDV